MASGYSPSGLDAVKLAEKQREIVCGGTGTQGGKKTISHNCKEGANESEGGVIIAGINDEGKVAGVQIGKRTIENLAIKIKENTDPKIFPGISVKNIENKEVILIKVEESRSNPYIDFQTPSAIFNE